MKWVKENKVHEESGLTIEAIRCKRKNGVWIEGEHWTKGPDGRCWYNLSEIEKWVESSAA